MLFLGRIHSQSTMFLPSCQTNAPSLDSTLVCSCLQLQWQLLSASVLLIGSKFRHNRLPRIHYKEGVQFVDKWVCQLLDSKPRGFLTSSYQNSPHVVPVVFVRLHDQIYSPIDAKPKSARKLRRVRNIEHNNAVALILDNYEDNWQKLWWLRLDCLASVVPISSAITELLMLKYPQYHSIDVGNSVIELSEIRWQYWSMDGSRPSEI